MCLTSARLKVRTTMWFVCLSLCLLSAGPGMAQTVCGPSIKTDRGFYPEPTPMPLPAAGGTFYDPTFGTRIMRVTDESTVSAGARTSYSYYSTFNLNNTFIFVIDPLAAHQGVIYRFNPTTFTLGQRLPDLPNIPNLGQTTKLEDSVWSYTDPDILFVHADNGTRIYRYNVEDPGYEFIADLSQYLPAGHFVTQMSVSQDEQTFAFNITGPDPYPEAGYIVYREPPGPTPGYVVRQSSEGVNEVRIDKTGRYLLVNKNLPEPSVDSDIEVQIIDLQTNTVSDLTDGAPDHAPSHYDVGTGIAVGAANIMEGITKRNMSTPHNYTRILDLDTEGNGGGFQLSLLADNEAWTLVNLYTQHAPGQVTFQREIIQVATDNTPGNERFRRLLHHQSIVQGPPHGYFDSPKANISRDGRFIAFTSNWGRIGANTRHDMFIAEIAPAPTPLPPSEVVWVEDAVPAGGIPVSDNDAWTWISTNPAQHSGSLAHQSSIFSGWHQHFFHSATNTLTVNAGEKLFTYIYLDPANLPSEIMLQWNNGTWEHRAYWGANIIPWGTDGTASRRYMGPLPAAGQWVKLEVPASQVGLEGQTLNGMAFTLNGGRATWDRAGKSAAATPTPTPTPTPCTADVVWVEDAVPAGSTAVGDTDGWNWVSSNPTKYSGSLAHQSSIFSGWHQHFFHSATSTLAVNTGDKLFTYIYLDPANPPTEVMLQWSAHNGNWEHRAYWGANVIPWGTDGTNSRRYMGALPATGQWVRLEVPASQVGLEGATLNGMAFTLNGGRATWDRAGKTP